VYTDKPTMANLLVTLMDKMDVPIDTSAAAQAGSARHAVGNLKCDTTLRRADPIGPPGGLKGLALQKGKQRCA
jgi:hypothetical protein